jgi:hypothetical protein
MAFKPSLCHDPKEERGQGGQEDSVQAKASPKSVREVSDVEEREGRRGDKQ